MASTLKKFQASNYWPAIYFAATFVVSISISLLIVDFIRAKRHESLDFFLSEKNRLVSIILKDNLMVRLDALNRLASKSYNGSKLNYETWLVEAKSNYNSLDGFRSIQWVDQGSQIKWIYPMKGNQVSLGFSTTSDTNFEDAFDFGSKNDIGSLTMPINIEQGGKGLMSIHPTFDSDGKHSGYVVGVFKYADLFSSISDQLYALEVISDKETLFKSDIEQNNSFARTLSIEVRNTRLDLKISPSDKMIEMYLDFDRIYLVFMMFLVFSIAISWFVYYLSKSVLNFKKALNQSNKIKTAVDEIAIYAETDKRGRITEVNEKFIEISGYSREELLGQDHVMLNSGYHEKAFFTNMWKTIASGKKWSGEVKNKKKDGDYYWVNTSIIPIKQNGTILGYSAIRQDITRSKIAEEKLVKNSRELKKALEAKSQFLANMSHEVRTPLNGILGMIHLMRDHTQNDEMTKLLESVERSGDLLLGIVNDILDASKIEAGQLTLERIPVLLTSIVQEIVAMFEQKELMNGNVLKIEFDEKIPKAFYGDPTRLKQILLNLIGNALKFSKNEEILIKSELLENQQLKISIKDKGIGIPEEKIEKLFTSFTQADESTTRRFGGTGLGLVICKSIIEKMNGSIHVESQVGHGTEFYFLLPIIACQAPVQEITKKSKEKPSYGKSSVLVVEDTPVNQDILISLLKKRKINTRLANDGLEAIEECKSSQFNLILMDCHMPRMDGFEATKAIIDLLGDQCPPIVAVTASATQEDRERCLATGMSDFITKPIRMKQLDKVLAEYLESEPKLKAS